jgi:hypothetical protein
MIYYKRIKLEQLQDKTFQEYNHQAHLTIDMDGWPDDLTLAIKWWS